jgi:type II secretory pathway component PulK
MKICLKSHSNGIALVIVMIVIVVLGILAGGFAYSMKVETNLARNTNFETDLEWMGRSGVEFARYILVQSVNIPNEPWDSLNQKWAGGPLGTNEVLESISLENNHLGVGTFSIKIVDLERRFNINTINQGNIYILQHALGLVGADPGETAPITDSFLDWIDPNDNSRLSGAESSDYMSKPNPGYPPYVAKNGLIDDMSELLLIRGITPEMFWGPGGKRGAQSSMQSVSTSGTGNFSAVESTTGLVGLFTAISVGTININTASAQVFQLMPGFDPVLVQGILRARAGWDGVDGTDDDIPFRSVGELINVPGMPPQIIQQLQGIFAVRSLTFEIQVEAKINQYKRQFVAVLRRNPANMRDVRTLYFHWR